MNYKITVQGEQSNRQIIDVLRLEIEFENGEKYTVAPLPSGGLFVTSLTSHDDMLIKPKMSNQVLISTEF